MKHKAIVIEVLEAELKRLIYDAGLHKYNLQSIEGKRNFERRAQIVAAIAEIKAMDSQIRIATL